MCMYEFLVFRETKFATWNCMCPAFTAHEIHLFESPLLIELLCFLRFFFLLKYKECFLSLLLSRGRPKKFLALVFVLK